MPRNYDIISMSAKDCLEELEQLFERLSELANNEEATNLLTATEVAVGTVPGRDELTLVDLIRQGDFDPE